jgi:hypothetical protein
MAEGGAPQLPLPEFNRTERQWLSRRYHRNVKAGTRATIAVCLASCLIYDWWGPVGVAEPCTP